MGRVREVVLARANFRLGFNLGSSDKSQKWGGHSTRV